ncbi:MAG: HAD hydrolase-like protein [Clostridium sp.]
MTYQTAVFDLDGTLLNTLEDLADAVNYSLKKNKMPLCTITQVCQYVGNGIVKLMERAVPSGKDNPVFEQALSDFKEYYAEHCHDKTALYPGVLALLQNLKKKGCENGGCIK